MNNLSIYRLIPTDSSGTVKQYLKDIKNLPLQTKEEEEKYLKMLNTDEREIAIKKLMESNLRYVVSIAKQYQYNYIHDFPLEDLIQLGNIGLYKAILSYNDPEYKVRLATYATYKIRGEILDSIISDKKGIHIPIYKTDQISKINKFINQFEQQNQYEPSIEVIAKKFDLPESEVSIILSLSKIAIEGESTSDPENESLVYLVPQKLEQGTFDKEVIINSIYSTLPKRQADIICSAYGIDCDEKSIDEIANEFELSERRINYIISDGLQKLRNNSDLINLIKG